eukprot:TRINITY_DN56683_c0_g1_i1.p1 TRINITY_DN56683_c0_g1~~TRINITY_DN56683_c0_g1_i1.p1  ORF type:complete len:343 (+),score=56.78 TRINITY_DN56683_c0_g1_i1:136-1164(+)
MSGYLPNRLDGLVPETGAWRGSTRYDSKAFGGAQIHIKRGFYKRPLQEFSDDDSKFIASGGIIFYSVQPTNWAEHDSPKNLAYIERHARLIKSVSPSAVLVCPGFEPDGHAEESQEKEAMWYGTADDYKQMYITWVKVFNEVGVDNVVWAMDFSAEIAANFFVVEKLWPGDFVQWLFFNVFTKKPRGQHGGNALEILDRIYRKFEEVGCYNHLPWGLGAWGVKKETFFKKPIEAEDRQAGLNDVFNIFDQGTHPRLKAAIYFNSMSSAIVTEDMYPAFQDLQQASSFVANDHAALHLLQDNPETDATFRPPKRKRVDIQAKEDDGDESEAEEEAAIHESEEE